MKSDLIGKRIPILALVVFIFLALLAGAAPVLNGLFVLIGHASQLTNSLFTIDTPPTYSNVQQNDSTPDSGDHVLLSAYWSDSTGLDHAWLATNETGHWQNKTGAYGSPINISSNSGWSNFTWVNASTSNGIVVAWAIYANDTSGTENFTVANGFRLTSAAAPPGEEEPPPVVSPGGGGGAAEEPVVEDFIIDKDLIKVSIKQGESTRERITITNVGNTALNMSLKPVFVGDLVFIGDSSFVLQPQDIREVGISIFAREDELPDAYTGRVVFTGGDITRATDLIIEVKAREPIFDVVTRSVDKKISIGEVATADITIENMGDLRGIDVLVHYSIKDFGGYEHLFAEDSVKLDDRLDISRSLRIPDDLPPGKYVFYIRISYGNITAASVDTFEVLAGRDTADPFLNLFEEFVSNITLVIWLVVILVVAAIVAMLVRQELLKKEFTIPKGLAAKRPKSGKAARKPRKPKARSKPVRGGRSRPSRKARKVRARPGRHAGKAPVRRRMKRDESLAKPESNKAIMTFVSEVKKAPDSFIGKDVTMSGNISFAEEDQVKDNRFWYFFSDGSGDVIAVSPTEANYNGRGIMFGKVRKTKSGEIFIEINAFG